MSEDILMYHVQKWREDKPFKVFEFAGSPRNLELPEYGSTHEEAVHKAIAKRQRTCHAYKEHFDKLENEIAELKSLLLGGADGNAKD